MTAFKKILPIFCCGIIFGVVFLTTEPPKSLTQASVFQILLFFGPLLLLLTFLINIFLGSLIRSLVISFGIILLLIFKSLDMFNLVTVFLTLLATFLIAVSFKNKRPIPPLNIRSLKLKQQH